MNLSSALHTNASNHPDKVALFCGDARMTYRELDESSTLLAQWFLDQGLRPGDRVALHWSNSIEVVQLFFALFRAGLIAVTVNVRLKPPEIRYVLDHSQARMCFSDPALARLAEQAGATCPILSQLPRLEFRHSSALPVVDPDSPAAILYTSGTTAHPKGVTHTHRSLCHTAAFVARVGIDTDDVVLAVTQVMHAAALNGVLLPALHVGAVAVLLPAFEPSAVLDAIERFRCTYTVCLPALLQFVVEEQARQPRQVSSLRTILAGGDTVSVALQNRFEAMFGIPSREVYGMTESLPVTVNPKAAIRPGSLGTRAGGLDIRLVDLGGRDVPEGETGEIVVRSAANFIGYWNDPAATKDAIEDGWVHTGDLASRDRDGYYWFKGRKKQIIIRAGSNISPQEVEEALYQHPAVLEAGVVGAPHPVYGETVAAFVVLRKGQRVDAQSLRLFAQRHLADYKVPDNILFLEELPKGLMGKVHRRALKEMLLANPAILEHAAVVEA